MTAVAAVAAAPLLSIGGAAADAGPDGGSPRCVSHAEFVQAAKGQTRLHIRHLFGTNGTFGDGGAGGFTREYTHCGKKTCKAVVEYNVGPKGVAKVALKHWNGICSHPV